MIETIYNDFTTKLLPKIQEGLVITKDYFTDLFSRYIHFLFIVDVLSAIACVVGAVILFFVLKRVWKYGMEEGKYEHSKFLDEMWPVLVIVLGVLAFIMLICSSITNTINAVKDKYIPEIRVIEKIQSYKNVNN